MAEIIGVSIWTAAGFICGDWRNWRKYHTTILLFILFDVIYYYITYNHRLWTLKPQFPLQTEALAILGEAIVFISTILMFLGNYPTKWPAAVRWNMLWVIIYSLNELFLLLTGTFAYDNNWIWLDSVLFNCIMFPMLRLHHTHPLLSYLLSIPVTLFYLWYFAVPIN